MLKVLLLSLVILTLFFTKTYSQTINFTGRILDKRDHLPISNSSVTIYSADSVIYQTASNGDGIFKIPTIYIKQCDYITLHALNYEDLKINSKKWKNKSNRAENDLEVFLLIQKKIVLKEVTVKSKRRYSDTTNIDLSKEKFERSIMIDDIFSKDFGFTKDANGQLYYKGKPVSDINVNGGDFFGKKNMDVYHLLPALILDNINVIETNIDSVTNATLAKPIVKINLKLKEKYNKGRFGNTNLAIGTSDRYLGTFNLYTYRNKEQISIAANTNDININDDFIIEPKVDFSSNGNNLTNKSIKLTYRNIFQNRLEVNLSIKGKLQEKNFNSETETQQEDVSIFSKTFTSSNSRSFDINDIKFNISYKIDLLNTIDMSQTFKHLHSKTSDSSNYFIKADSQTTTSQLDKLRGTNTNLYTTKIGYQRKFNSKKGRFLDIGIEVYNDIYGINELDNVYDASTNQFTNNYFINGAKSAQENKYTITSSFTEPITDNGYINFFYNYENDNINYNTKTNSDTTIISTDAPAISINQYFKPGIKFQETFKKFSFDLTSLWIYNLRTNEEFQSKSANVFFNFNADLRVDYKISSKKDIGINYSMDTNYPNIQQLTNLNSSFDLISQNNGNINLKPEQKKYIKFSYGIKPSDSENISITGEVGHIDQKIGLATVNLGNNLNPGNVVENTTEENVGSSNEAQLSFSFLKRIYTDKYLSTTIGISYQEAPSLVNNKLILNNGLTFNQSFSTSIVISKSLLTMTPIIASSLTKFYYGANDIDITSLTYSDKLSLTLKAFQLDIFPLINYSHSINNNFSFSMNGKVKRPILKDYGAIWIQAYDIFNSFKYVNNYLGPLSYQTVKYSNLGRYIILGISLKFNNMK